MHLVKSALRTFVELNVRLSRTIDSVLPVRLRTDGNRYFATQMAPGLLSRGITVYDLGGGSRPFVSLDTKRALEIRVVGLDISHDELNAAPPHAYDETIAVDLCSYRGSGDADLVICQATLEHVPDTPGAVRAIAEILKPGGRVCVFAPSRNAAFARINRLLPHAVRTTVLFSLFPSKAHGHDGFAASYDHCTPRDIETLAKANGLVVERRELFWISSYFMIFTPAFVLWRLGQGLYWLLRRDQAAETFAYVLAKTP